MCDRNDWDCTSTVFLVMFQYKIMGRLWRGPLDCESSGKSSSQHVQLCSSAEEHNNLLDDFCFPLSETVLWRASKYNSVQINRSCPCSEICSSLVPLIGKSVWRSYSAWKKPPVSVMGRQKWLNAAFIVIQKYSTASTEQWNWRWNVT